jgi:hypothetical protein
MTTDTLTTAIAAWVAMVAQRLDAEHAELMRNCVAATGADLRVVARLKEGTIVLEGVNDEAGKYVEFYREDVKPMREVQLQ